MIHLTQEYWMAILSYSLAPNDRLNQSTYEAHPLASKWNNSVVQFRLQPTLWISSRISFIWDYILAMCLLFPYLFPSLIYFPREQPLSKSCTRISSQALPLGSPTQESSQTRQQGIFIRHSPVGSNAWKILIGNVIITCFQPSSLD